MRKVADKILETTVLIVACAEGLAIMMNAAFMLISPQSWYFFVPGLSSTGPLNAYFVREIGIIEVLVASMYFIGVIEPTWRFACWAGATLWHTARLVLVAIDEPDLLMSAQPFIILPSAIGLAISTWACWKLWPVTTKRAAIDADWTFETRDPDR